MPVKKVTEAQLKRMKKKGKVRKKMGAQPEKERLEPVAPETEGMSGSEGTERPAPTLPEPDTGMAAMSASMEMRDKLLTGLVENNTRAIQEFGEKLATLKPAELSKFQRADFVRHQVVRDKQTSLIDYVDSIPMERKS